MARSDAIEAEHRSPFEEQVELDVAIALDTWVRCAAAAVGVYEWLDDVEGELVAEVEAVVFDVELVRYPAGVVDVRDRTATGVRFAAP